MTSKIGTPSINAVQNRRVISVSSGFWASSVAVRGSKAMRKMGHTLLARREKKQQEGMVAASCSVDLSGASGSASIFDFLKVRQWSTEVTVSAGWCGECPH